MKQAKILTKGIKSTIDFCSRTVFIFSQRQWHRRKTICDFQSSINNICFSQFFWDKTTHCSWPTFKQWQRAEIKCVESEKWVYIRVSFLILVRFVGCWLKFRKTVLFLVWFLLSLSVVSIDSSTNFNFDWQLTVQSKTTKINLATDDFKWAKNKFFLNSQQSCVPLFLLLFHLLNESHWRHYLCHQNAIIHFNLFD